MRCNFERKAITTTKTSPPPTFALLCVGVSKHTRRFSRCTVAVLWLHCVSQISSLLHFYLHLLQVIKIRTKQWAKYNKHADCCTRQTFPLIVRSISSLSVFMIPFLFVLFCFVHFSVVYIVNPFTENNVHTLIRTHHKSNEFKHAGNI